MRDRRRALLAGRVSLLVTLFAGLPVSAEPFDPPRDVKQLVKVDVLPADGGTYVPGKPTPIAVRLRMAPEWHVYWLNPGDSGIATAPRLILPPGWTQGEWQFPVPKTFMQPGDLIGYGYENEVVLLTTVTPPATPAAGAAGVVEITAEVVFLVCKDICLPGQGRQTVRLTPGDGVLPPATAEVLRTWSARLPEPAAETGVVARGRVTGSQAWSVLEVVVPVPEGTTKAEVYPLVPEVMEVRGITVEVAGGRAIIKMEGKLYTGQTLLPPSLKLVLASETAKGGRVGRWVELPLGPTPPSGATSRPAGDR